MSTSPYTGITNLVFEGGGVKGLAYIGALKALDEQGVLPNITAVAGTSAGAITACLLSLGYSAEKLYDIIFTMDLASFEDGKKWGTIINDILDINAVRNHYGINPGQTFLEWLEQQIAGSGHNFPSGARATFAELHAAGCRELRVYSCDLNLRTVVEFSHEHTPDVAVADAVRASMSIPLFFQSFQFPNGQQGGHYFVDGGTVFNYPIGVFDQGPGGPAATLGFRLENLDADPNNPPVYGPNGPHDLKDYIESLFQLLLDAQSIDFHHDEEEEKRTIVINDFGVSATAFNISPEMKQKLYKAGYDAVVNRQFHVVGFDERAGV